MEFDDSNSGAPYETPDETALPRHLTALVGALQGPADLGAHHDHYLSYPHEEETDRAITV
ncbi:hypothetical protein [Herbidospora yilanensis]|uniref:hypothetical protein n=1 Tax=Herbidospora yilanensis TaxID=354426 RepID=UPI000B2512CB|nr:hypothetical protein [Herbidospora yilanensis]